RSFTGLWMLTRYDDVALVLRDPRFGRKGFTELAEPGAADGGLAASMLFQDPPDHTRLRTLVSKAFTPRTVDGIRPRIQQIVDRLLDRARDRHEMDLIADLAVPLPVTVISEVLGVPAADHDRVRHWALDVAQSLDAAATADASEAVGRVHAAHDALASYFRPPT